jgi:hypothetical protein
VKVAPLPLVRIFYFIPFFFFFFFVCSWSKQNNWPFEGAMYPSHELKDSIEVELIKCQGRGRNKDFYRCIGKRGPFYCTKTIEI